jgi:ribosomal-protein-alanine N-acetyltransferase
MIIETPRLTLRPFREEDLDALALLMSNPDFMRFSRGVFSREQTETFLGKILNWDRAGTPSQFALTMSLGRDRLLGYCGFFPQRVDEIDEIEIGYRLEASHWGRGLATEAARAVRDHGFNDLGLPRVISLIHSENKPSRRVAEKNGMALEKETLFRGFPTLVYAIRNTNAKGH